MRWFVEVSRVGENDPAEKYCVEAKAWQAALQEARKLRGDSGPLSKFSIELLDQGYRAVDAELKIRYFVNNAPADAPLTETNGSSSSKVAVEAKITPSAKPAAVLPAAKVLPDGAPFPLLNKTPSKPPSAAPAPTSAAASAVSSDAPGQTTSQTSKANNVVKSAVPRPSPNSARPRSVAPAQPNIVVPADPVPPAPRVPNLSDIEPPAHVPPVATAVTTVPLVSVVPVSPVVSVAAAAIAATPAAIAAIPIPAHELIRERGEEPRDDSPITYRELALAVRPQTSRPEVEALLWARYRELAGRISDRTAGKFIQLAIFDHVFKKKPERPPLATLAWKDWRGDPVLAFPGFGEAPAGPVSGVPVSRAASSEVPSTLPTGVAPNNHSAAAPPVAVASAAPVAAAPTPAPVPVAEPTPAPVAVAPAAVAAPAAAAPAVAAPAAAPAASASPAATVVMLDPFAAPTAPTVLNITPPPSAPPSSSPGSERPSRPRIAGAARRRAPGEDLIGDLFETMHELHFMRDVGTGSEFVLSVLNEVLPCEGVLVHVFDINSRNFVVVRAKGASPRDVLLTRLSDQDSLCTVVMRALSAVSLPDVREDARFAAPRWQTVGVAPRAALCGAVRQGGRYLGMVELVNPLGDTPFHEGEINALDYICEQFAEFLTNRPIVLDSDVILGR